MVRHSESSSSSDRSNSLRDRYSQKMPSVKSCMSHTVYTFLKRRMISLSLIFRETELLYLDDAAHWTRHRNMGMHDKIHSALAVPHTAEMTVQ